MTIVFWLDVFKTRKVKHCYARIHSTSTIYAGQRRTATVRVGRAEIETRHTCPMRKAQCISPFESLSHRNIVAVRIHVSSWPRNLLRIRLKSWSINHTFSTPLSTIGLVRISPDAKDGEANVQLDIAAFPMQAVAGLYHALSYT